jgi:hypothetical protein
MDNWNFDKKGRLKAKKKKKKFEYYQINWPRVTKKLIAFLKRLIDKNITLNEVIFNNK